MQHCEVYSRTQDEYFSSLTVNSFLLSRISCTVLAMGDTWKARELALSSENRIISPTYAYSLPY